MTATQIRLPRVSMDRDLLDTLAAFHEAMRDVAAWIPTIVDGAGAGSPRDARWLRAFLRGPLAWHMADEETVLFPWLTLRRSGWLDACLARTSEKHEGIVAAAQGLEPLLERLCAGDAVQRLRWLREADRLAQAIEDDLRYEDDVVLPSARLFLDATERAAIVLEIATRDEARAWDDVAVAGDTAIVHSVHAVRTHTAAGLAVLRSFADCPRHRATDVAACAGCPHLEDMGVDDKGRGHVACAIDDQPAPERARISDIMTRDVICVEKDVKLTDAIGLLADACITGMPVVDARGRPVGVVSQSDILRTGAADAEGRLVSDVMMHAPIVVRESDTVEDAARLLILEGIHRLPVINADHIVVGIVSTLDLLRATVRMAR